MPDAKDDATVVAENVTVQLDGRTVLIDASLRARAGEVLALLGPHGAGQSWPSIA